MPSRCVPPSLLTTSNKHIMFHGSLEERSVALFFVLLYSEFSHWKTKHGSPTFNLRGPWADKWAIFNQWYLKEDFSPASPSFFPPRRDKEENDWIKIAFISHSESSLFFPWTWRILFSLLEDAPDLHLHSGAWARGPHRFFCWTDPVRSVGSRRSDVTGVTSRRAWRVTAAGCSRRGHSGHTPTRSPGRPRADAAVGAIAGPGARPPGAVAVAVAVSGRCAARSARGRASVRRPGGYISSRWIPSPNKRTKTILNPTAFLSKTSTRNPNPACEFFISYCYWACLALCEQSGGGSVCKLGFPHPLGAIPVCHHLSLGRNRARRQELTDLRCPNGSRRFVSCPEAAGLQELQRTVISRQFQRCAWPDSHPREAQGDVPSADHTNSGSKGLFAGFTGH